MSDQVLFVQSFNKEQPVAWFIMLESYFKETGIQDDDVMYRRLMASLDADDLLQVIRIIESPPSRGKYNALKTHILNTYLLSNNIKLKDTFHACRRFKQPSQLLEEIEDLTRGLSKEDLLKILWLSHLPQAAQAELVNKAEHLLVLCVLADEICNAANCHSSESANLTTKASIRSPERSSSMCNKSVQSIRDEIVQTEYDPGFEQWYRQSYSNKFNERPNHTETKTVINERKTVQTLFMRGENIDASFYKKNQKEKRLEKETSSTSFELSQKCSGREFSYHKSVEEPECWVSLSLYESSSSQEQCCDSSKSEDLLIKGDSLNLSASDKIEVKHVQATFDEFNLENKLQNQLKYFEEKVHTNKLKLNMLSLQTRQMEEHLRLLKCVAHTVPFDITDEMLEEIIKPWNNLNIDIQSEVSMTVAVPLNLKMDLIDDYEIKYKDIFKEIYTNSGKYPQFSSITENFDAIFYQCEIALPSCNNKISKRPIKSFMQRTVRNRGDFLNHKIVFPKYRKKVKVFIKILEEIFSINKTLRDVDFPSEADIINQLISKIVRPKVAKLDVLHSDTLSKWMPDFSVDTEVLPKWYFKCDKYSSKMTKNNETGKKECRNKCPSKLTHYFQYFENDYGEKEKLLFDLRAENYSFKIPVFNSIGEKNLKKEIKQITRFLKDVLKHRDGFRVALKTLLNIRFDVSRIINAVTIDIGDPTHRIYNIQPSNIFCLKPHYKLEYKLTYQLMRPVDPSLYLRCIQGKNRGLNISDNFLCAILHADGLTRILRDFQNSLKEPFEILVKQLKNNQHHLINQETRLKHTDKDKAANLELNLYPSKVNDKELERNTQAFRIKLTEESESGAEIQYNSILNLYQSISSSGNHNANYSTNMAMGDSRNVVRPIDYCTSERLRPTPKDKSRLVNSHEKIKKNRRSWNTIAPMTNKFEASCFGNSTSKKIEVLHKVKTANWQEKSNSTLAISKEYLDARCTCRTEESHELLKIEFLLDSNSEIGNYKSISTLALSDDALMNTDKKRKSVKRNCYETQKKSLQDPKQQESYYLNTENSELLTEKDSILELYQSLQYIDDVNKGSTKNNITCVTKCQDNNDFSIETKKRKAELVVKDSILCLYLNLD